MTGVDRSQGRFSSPACIFYSTFFSVTWKFCRGRGGSSLRIGEAPGYVLG